MIGKPLGILHSTYLRKIAEYGKQIGSLLFCYVLHECRKKFEIFEHSCSMNLRFTKVYLRVHTLTHCLINEKQMHMNQTLINCMTY